MKRNLIPIVEIGPVIGELIAERWPYGGGQAVLAEKIGCDESTIWQIANGEKPYGEFDLIDKILCALGRFDHWYGRFEHIYPSKFMETCALPSCGHTFPESRRSGKRKRFCSDNCRSLYWKTQAGEATGLRMVQRGKCFKGHKMTPENTLQNRQPDGSYKKQCRKCRLESMAAYKRKQRREQRDEINRKQREYRARRRATARAA